MKKKLSLLFLSTIIFVTMFATTPTQAQPPTELSTDPLPCTATVGTRFNVSITIVCEEVELFVWQFNMTFNPTVLAVVNVTEGSFLSEYSGYPTMWPDPVIHNDTGWVGAGCSLKRPDGGFPPFGAIGSGEIAIITFYVKEEGKSDLHFAGVFPGETEKQQTMLRSWDPIGKVLIEILFTPNDGFFQVPQGDVTNDGIVDAEDLAALGRAYSTQEGQTSYNPDADLNKNKIVERSDLEIISSNYGAT
jgi:hypothetical protein